MRDQTKQTSFAIGAVLDYVVACLHIEFIRLGPAL